jgi:hypothetical protein
MEFGFGFGVGFALGIVMGIHISRVCWPEFDESIWDRKKREKQMIDEAIHKELEQKLMNDLKKETLDMNSKEKSEQQASTG